MDIVRRKPAGQTVDSRERPAKSMSRKSTVGLAVAALGCGAVAFYWLHARGEQHMPDEVVSPEPAGFHDALPPGKPTRAPTINPQLPAVAKEGPPPVTPPLPIH